MISPPGKLNLSIKTIGICLFMVFSLNSCKTLNSNVSLVQLQERSSLEMRSIFTNPDTTSCDLGFQIYEGEKTLKNNLWGKSKVKKGDPTLCIYKKGELMGWKWDVPDNAKGVIGYPAVQIGQSPFSKINKIKYGFPVEVASITKLVVDYDFETHVKHSKFNLAFDIWLTDSQFSTKENIKTEIMIWEDYFDFTSYGKKIETIITPFGIYKVYAGYLENPKYGQDWQYIAFVRQSPREKGEVDVNHLLNYLINKELIAKEHYMTCFELGNEIGNSSGMTLVKKFDYIIETK